MIIKTNRLVLRPLKKSDASDIVRHVSNIEVSKWLLVVPHPYNLKDANWWINSSLKKSKEKVKETINFAIVLKETKKLIGSMGLHKIDQYQGTGEVGYWIGTDYHQKGYGSEALEAVLDFSFNKLKLRRVEAGVFSGNPSSGKLLEKFGFKYEGTRMQSRRCKADGQLKDEILYGLLKEDYLKLKN